MLEKDATKNTIFFDDFTAMPFVVSRKSEVGLEIEIQKVPIDSRAFVSELSKLCKIGSKESRCCRDRSNVFS